MRINNFFILSLVIFGFLFSGCSGGGGSSSSSSALNNIGVFLDSAVEGVKYKTSSGLEGYTNAKGEYEFKTGDTVEFLVGNISLGNIQAKELISVLELKNPKESSLILQSLDTDGNPNNGINISKETFKLFENSTIDIKEVSVNNSKFTSEYKDLTKHEFKLADNTALEHAHHSMMLENLKSIGGNLYAYYVGHNNIYNYRDNKGLKVNKNRLQAYSNRRLQLYYFKYFISPELNLNTAYQYNKLKNQEEAHKAVEKFLSNTATATNEVVALTDLDPTNLKKHIVDRSLNYAKGLALKDGLSKKEDKFASNPSISNASQIALYRAMVNIDSCQGIYKSADLFEKAINVTKCASALLSDGANIFNDSYMAYNYYTTVKESNTIQLVRAYLEEYFNSAGDINFMYARYGVTTEKAFIDALKKSVLAPSVAFWSNGDPSVDNELFTSLILKYKQQASEKVNIMKDTYGLKSNFDALDTSVVIPEITKSKYDVTTDKFTVCYKVDNESYFDVKDIKLKLQIKDENSVLASKNIQLMNMYQPFVTDEQCLDFSHSGSVNLSAGSFVTVVSEIGYNIENKAYSFTASQDLYFTDSNLFDLLEKITPPVIKLDLVTNKSKDEDLFFASAKNSSVDASQGTLSFKWKQVDIDGYTLSMSGNTSPDITITTPKLPQGVTQKIVWVEVTATASISKKETIKTFKIIVDSSQETLVELPKAYAGKDISVVQGSTVTFNAQNTNKNYDGGIDWFWIDDNNEVLSTEKSFEKSFEKTGVYKFRLESYKPSLSDTSSMDELTVTVLSAATPPISTVPKVTSLSPTTATQNIATTFTITGENLPDTIAMSLQDSVVNSCSLLSNNSTTVEMRCIPASTGTKSIYVATKSGGSKITSDVNLSVTVAGSSTISTAPNFTNSCYNSPKNVFDQVANNADGSEWYECTRYAFGRSCETTGVELTYTQATNRDAGKWYDIVDASYARGSEPKANSIAVWSKDGNYGHVAFVESVNGENVTISEANWASPLDGKYNGQRTLTKTQMQTHNSSSGFILQGYVYLTKNPTVTLSNVASKSVGLTFDFTANLSDTLVSEDTLKISLGDGGGGYLNPVEMTPNVARNTFTYTSPAITTAGTRKYRVAIFNGGTKISSWIDGIYIVSNEPIHKIVSENIGNDRDALISPNGGEIWTYGKVETIQWATQYITGSTVDLYVLHDNPSGLFDKTSQTLGNIVNTKTWYKFAPNIENTGSYVVDPANMNGNGGAYMVLVVSTTDNTKWDISDGMFTLRSTTLKKTGQTTSYVTYDDGYYQKGATPSYTRDNTNNIVTDNVTKLQWQDDTTPSTMTWTDAGTYCTNLSLGAYTDWRLPTRKELVSLSDYGRVSPAIDPTFQNTISSLYWSSTTYASYSSLAWIVHFSLGNQGNNSKTNTHYVRCVRAGQ